MSKRGLIVLLVGLNAALLAALMFTAYSPPRAFGQVASGRQSVLIAARAEQGNDAVYLLDGANKQLHVFRTNYPRQIGQPIMIRYFGFRDLARDFAAGAGTTGQPGAPGQPGGIGQPGGVGQPGAGLPPGPAQPTPPPGGAR